jgi:hypothetical protein
VFHSFQTKQARLPSELPNHPFQAGRVGNNRMRRPSLAFSTVVGSIEWTMLAQASSNACLSFDDIRLERRSVQQIPRFHLVPQARQTLWHAAGATPSALLPPIGVLVREGPQA